jgi:putative ABC transport system substrate-binding protein
MRRRELMLLLGSAMTVASGLKAQQKTKPVIGYLASATPAANTLTLPAFIRGLGETGYVDGQNCVIAYRWAQDQYDRLPALAAELVASKVDMIVSTGGITGAFAAKNASATVPIVFIVGDDPVERGLVTSLARPGGNLTGISFLTGGLMPKRLELISELVPQVKTISVLVNPNNASAPRQIRDIQEAARTKGLELHVLKAGTDSAFEPAFVSVLQRHSSPLIIGSDPFFYSRRDQFVTLAAQYAIPTIYERREFVEAGGLISYGPNFADTWRRAGIYAGKVLNGTKPSDLPVEQPMRLELVVNSNTAKTLGLTVPPSILVRADEVIE